MALHASCHLLTENPVKSCHMAAQWNKMGTHPNRGNFLGLSNSHQPLSAYYTLILWYKAIPNSPIQSF